MNQSRRGYLYGLGAYLIWGFFPIYIKLLRPAGSVEILAHRIVWSVVFVAVMLAAMRRWTYLRGLVRRPKTLAGLGLAAALIATNWGTYIYGVNANRVVETALGYFITPLAVVLLGVTVLRERLRAAQWAALGLGGLALAVLAVEYGRPPYLAVALALTFSGYSLIKKRLAVPAVEGLLVESAGLTLPALAYLGWLTWRSESTFGQVSAWHTVLLLAAGPATAIPLLLFANAANRLPLTALGVLQYATPILQLAFGIVVFHEPMPPARLAGFAIVWLALIVFTVDGMRHARRQSRAAAPAQGTSYANSTVPSGRVNSSRTS
jgi:chloramphenicol-sensitive protein RarD